MTNYLKLVKSIDRVTDYIPVVSTVKNAGILLYQLVHKVNNAAAPLNTSWTDDVKIHVLSKDRSAALIAMIPVIGNLTTFSVNAQNDAAKANRMIIIGGPMGYLAEASRRWSVSLKTHSQEVAALYLARNPNRPLATMEKSLKFAVACDNKPVIKLIVDSRNDWSTEGIIEALKHSRTPQTSTYLLDNFLQKVKASDMGQVLEYVLSSYQNNKTVLANVLLQYFPDMPIESVAKGVHKLMEMAYKQYDPEVRREHLDYAFTVLKQVPNIDISKLLLLAQTHKDTTTLNRLQAFNTSI
ncbi:MAG: hypothetical protein LLF94_02090 [Chlamydiales bacterium]|nr:hypothetical protein [Chlamydiales bacterium]